MSWQYRLAGAGDVDALRALIMEHGPNPWNWLPEDGVEHSLRQVAEGEAWAALFERDGLLGAAILYRLHDAFPLHRPAGVATEQAGYIMEAVVRRDQAGQGLGSLLLQQACDDLAARGAYWVVADRHEENAASGGMMRKAGFAELASFDDPERRAGGSRRSTVCGRRVG
ncbi:ribosomal protein S18 acetylase RimI-like enzyme [Chromobacterium alkanivorans]|uniref:GNAT family N-acetyltransferase n=1 Tax=Chromobacterium alkanivorans TaxID=1071719 RepID=UPI001968225A|nr:GNAT family N-acetyltransferase [Chromobacterium alkanivorans]MBN3004778.1 GNAT family N-acetyltransferase [Chromobacterium alkanivorans]MCS3803075.1 ribosomal protein S18 acetylase RimI-like enzyme [Chromobacterium alkanivorans]MCS3817815.1 ribosomal protein S18 acetylase RimI-like enzyme [Chromobacterium alkanivorans]MCS3872441.1 ribosomal protein S18 acetylase RimI-like enzyme [Chromobacterium alkanivorans]